SPTSRRLPEAPRFPYPTPFRSVEGVVEALAQGLGHEGEVGLAADGLEQRVGLEALQVRGRPLALVHAGDEQRTHGGVTEARAEEDRKSTRLNSSHLGISYAVVC